VTCEQRRRLLAAFKFADDYVVGHTSCPCQSAVANGWCDRWVKAVKKRAPFVEIRQAHGHCFVVFEDVAYDSDTYGEDVRELGGFAVPGAIA